MKILVAIGCIIGILIVHRWYGEGLERNDETVGSSSANHVTERAPDQRSRAVEYQASGHTASIDASETKSIKLQITSIATCLKLEKQRAVADSLLRQQTQQFDEYARRNLDERLQAAGAMIEKLEQGGACNGVDRSSLTGAIYPLLLKAAKSGDYDAALCYATADFDVGVDQKKPEAVEEYRRNALSFVQESLVRGDWRVVELLIAANDHDSDPHRGRYSWFREISNNSPVLAYGYTRLLQLGADSSYAAQVDQLLKKMGDELTPQQILDQDAWAQSEFKRHFSNSPPITSMIPICTLYSDTRVFHNTRSFDR